MLPDCTASHGGFICQVGPSRVAAFKCSSRRQGPQVRGSGTASLILTGDVIDSNGAFLGDLQSILLEAIQARERLLHVWLPTSTTDSWHNLAASPLAVSRAVNAPARSRVAETLCDAMFTRASSLAGEQRAAQADLKAHVKSHRQQSRQESYYQKPNRRMLLHLDHGDVPEAVELKG